MSTLLTDSEQESGWGDAPPAFICAKDVVLLHGFMGMPWTMRALGRSLRSHGFDIFCPWYESWATSFDRIVERVVGQLDRHGLGMDRPVAFVGHSMGGLVAQAVARHMPAKRVASMVLIGTPNAGSELADFCAGQPLLRPLLGRAAATLVTRNAADPTPYVVGVIAGDRPLPSPLRIMPRPHDGKVSVASTHIVGEADHIILPVSHAVMPFDRNVQKQTRLFLAEGKFDHG